MTMPAPRDDPAREVLIDERALHVDVAEQDAVHGVVEQHVELLDGGHPGDLAHAEARRVVGLREVAAAPREELVRRACG
jgi:hypothetical protein